MAEQPFFFRAWCAYRAGRKDASPAAKLMRAQERRPQLFPYADGIRHCAELAADDATARHRREIVKPAERYRQLVTRYDTSVAPALRRSAQAYDEATGKLEQLNAAAAQTERPERADVVFNHRVYPWVMAALVVLEFPFNLMVMQVLGENLVLTAFLAGGISILVPLLGHIIGKQLRLRHYLSAVAIAASGFGLLLAGAFFRMTYLREAAQVTDNRTLYAFFAIGVVFLMVSTFASRYSEPGEDERVPRELAEAKGAARRRRRDLEEAEREESRLREAIQVAFERGQLVQDLRDIDVQRAIDRHNLLLESYWRGLQRSWNGSQYPSDIAGFHIESCPQPTLWPPLAIGEQSAPAQPDGKPNISVVA